MAAGARKSRRIGEICVAHFEPDPRPGKMPDSFFHLAIQEPAMSIKSDKWIRRMAQEHGMIEPFVERQMRGEGADRLISFGVSSYGYDVRCADEFKVFTNINSATVDPKNF